jgi:hypothetical protein
MSPSHFFIFFKKKKKKYAGVAEPLHWALGVAKPPLGQTGWSTTPYGVVRPPQHISYFFTKNKICDGGILGKKCKSGQIVTI